MSQLAESHKQNSRDVETTLMALENTLEQIESLASQIPDFQRQVGKNAKIILYQFNLTF